MNKFLATLEIETAIIRTDQAHREFADLDVDKIMRELPPDVFSYLQSKNEESIESAFLVGWLEARDHENRQPKQTKLF